MNSRNQLQTGALKGAFLYATCNMLGEGDWLAIRGGGCRGAHDIPGILTVKNTSTSILYR